MMVDGQDLADRGASRRSAREPGRTGPGEPRPPLPYRLGGKVQFNGNTRIADIRVRRPERSAERSLLTHIASADYRDYLDDYVETHVHGGVLLAQDAEALVLDPCFRGTAVEETARQLPCAVEWHPGFVLSVDDVRRYPDFKTPEAVALAERIAGPDGLLDARMLGETALTGRDDPQTLKYVWHYIARFGRPAGSMPAA